MINIHTLIQSFGYALEGIVYALQHNQNLRIAFVIAFVVIGLSIFFQVTPFEMGILGVMILLLVCTEMLNTAIEEMVNFITREHQKEAKIAKDVSAGMVLLTLVGSIIVEILVFAPYVLRYFHFK